jgi:hypothetical protein
LGDGGCDDGDGGGADAGGVGVGRGDGGGDGLGDAEGDAEGLAEGDAEGDAEGEGEAVGDADGVALQPPARKMYWVLAPLQPFVMPGGWEYQSRMLPGRALMNRFIVVLPTCSP